MIRKLLPVILLLFFTLGIQNLFAQNRTISGTITDSKGTSIIGATIVVKGTSIGTTSDVDGKYTLDVPANTTVVEFTYTGKKTQDIPLGASNEINVSLEDITQQLNEVVVTALGISQQKNALNYAVQDVNGSELTKAGNTDVINGLAGKVAGLNITNSSGQPGASSYIVLRGSNTIEGDPQPLFVLDGVPIDNSSFGISLGGVDQSDRLIDINPNDIASVTVLKGPSAAALYGIKGSNGVILITTKHGTIGAKNFHVDFTTSYTLSQPDKLLPLQNQFAQGSNGIWYGPAAGGASAITSWGPNIDSLYWSGTPYTSRGDSQKIYDRNGKIIGQSQLGAYPNAKKVVPYNPYDFFQTGTQTDNSLVFSGGGPNGSYRISVGYTNQNGIVPLSDFKRTTVGFSLENKMTNSFSVGASATWSSDGGDRIQTGSNRSGLMLGMERTPPTFDNTNGTSDPVHDSASFIFHDGTQRDYAGTEGSINPTGYDNPYWTINENTYNDQVDRIIGQITLNYTPLNWLSVLYRIGGDVYTDMRNSFIHQYSISSPEGTASNQVLTSKIYNSDLIVTLTKKFNSDLNGSLELGNNVYSSKLTDVTAEGISAVPGLSLPNLQNYLTPIDGDYYQQQRSYAFYGDAKLEYKNMLYFEATGREEANSFLVPGHNTFFFPSASIGFIFTEPLHLETSKFLQYGKIRFSYAQVGNVPPGPYFYTNVFSQASVGDGWTGGVSYPFTLNGNSTPVPGYQYNSSLGNLDMVPEKDNSYEAGLELKFFGDRLGLDGTYYDTKANDVILTAQISPSSGFSSEVQNSGSIENHGVEVELNLTPIVYKDFRWDIDINWAKNISKVLSLSTGAPFFFLGGFVGTEIGAVVGEPYPIIYGNDFYRDANGNMIIDNAGTPATNPRYGYPISDPTLKVLGRVPADWTGAVVNTFTWKGFSLTGVLDIKSGGQMWDGPHHILGNFGTTAQSADRGTPYVFPGVLGTVDSKGNITTDGQANNISIIKGQPYYAVYYGGFTSPSTPYIENSGWVRLRDIDFSYTISKTNVPKLPVGSISIGFVAHNLWLSTKYYGIDPNTSLAGSATAQGLDYFDIPSVKDYGFSLKIGI